MGVALFTTRWRIPLAVVRPARDWGTMLLAGHALYLLAYLAWLAFPWGEESHRVLIGDASYLIGGIAPTLLSWRVACRGELAPTARRAWRWLALGQGCYWVANGLWAYYEVVLGLRAFPSWANGAYLLTYICWLPGLLAFAPRHRTWTERATFWLDSGMVVLVGGMVAWYFILLPLATRAAADLLTTALALAYPLGDLLLLSGLASIVLRESDGGSRAALELFGLGLLLFLTGDLLLAYLEVQSAYATGGWLDLTWMLGLFLMAVAAHRQWRAGRASPSGGPLQQHQRALHVLPYVAVTAGFAFLLAITPGERTPRYNGVLLGAVVLVVCVLARQVLALCENIRLYHTARREAERRAALLRVTRRLALEHEPGRLLTALLTEAEGLLGAEASGVYRWDEAGQCLHLTTTTIQPHLVPATVQLPLGSGIAGRAAQRRAVVIENDYQRLERPAGWAVRAGIRAGVAAPLLHEGRLLGALSICTCRPGVRFTAEDGELLELLAGTAASALVGLERARLYEQARREIAERERAEAALRESEARYRSVVDNVKEIIFQTDTQGRWVFLNPAWTEVTGFEVSRSLGTPCCDYIHPEDQEHCLALFHSLAERHRDERRQELRLLTRSGGVRWVEVVARQTLDPSGRALGISGTLADITERRAAEEALRHQALHDALTGLPNRLLLQDRLEQAILAARRNGTPLALLVLNLDRFKEVNEALGHQVGDMLLREVARRLQSALRASDTVARLSGDEFAVLLPGADPAGALESAERLGAALGEPFAVYSQALDVGASLGITLYPEHGEDAETLLRHAGVAMSVAKRAGSGCALYDAEQDRHSADRLALAGDLRRAIRQGELLLHYQPKVDLRAGRLVGVEALVRWQHPERGLVPPDQFIPLAEQTGLIKELTEQVLDDALHQCAAWRAAGHVIPVAVNISMRSLHDNLFPGRVARLLEASGVPPAWLHLEVTESAMMADPATALRVLERLRGLGVRIAVDDFGTGYSSLSYLKQVAADELKVDRSFVRDMTSDEADLAIVRATIDLGHRLDLSVVAEGVEDEATLRLLADLGCDAAQGYYFGRPMPAEALAEWLERTAPLQPV